MHEFFQALEVAVFSVRLNELRIRPLVDIAYRYGPEAAVELRGERAPRVIAVFRAAQEAAEAQIDERLALGIADVAVLIRLRLRVVRKGGVLRYAEVGGRVVSKEGTRVAFRIDVAAITASLAIEERVATHLRRAQLLLPGHEGIELRAEWADLRRGLECRNGTRHQVKRVLNAHAIGSRDRDAPPHRDDSDTPR